MQDDKKELSYAKCAEHLLDCIGSFGSGDVRYFGEQFETFQNLIGFTENEMIEGIQSVIEDIGGKTEDINTFIYALFDVTRNEVLKQCTDKIEELRTIASDEVTVEYLRKIGIETWKVKLDIPEQEFVFELTKLVLDTDVPLMATQIKQYIYDNTTEPDDMFKVLDDLDIALEKYRDDNSIYTNCMDSHMDMNGLFPIEENEDIEKLIEKFLFNIYEKYIL